jgi:LysM repeat protein
MVSHQSVRRLPGTVAGVAGTLSLLALAGCQLFAPRNSEPVAAAAPPPPASRPAPKAPAAPQQTSVEAAIARAANEPQTVTVAPAPAPMPAVKATAPLSYTVKRGDTLWDISNMFLRDPWLWPEIWHVNPAVQNPHFIYPGDVLALATGADGQPEITLTRGNVLRVQPLIRSTPIDGPIATIPFDAIKAFLGKPSIVSKDDLLKAPRVAGLRDSHMVAGAGHEFYVKGMENYEPGRYSVVRVGEEFKDPESGKVLGYMGTYTGAARIDRIADLSKALLIDSARETTSGDLLFAEDAQTVSADLLPRSPPAGVDGQIIAVVDGVAMIGSYQVVAINRGSRDGLEAGHVLAIDAKGEVVPDGSCKKTRWSFCADRTLTLPSERAGTLLVFKTYEQLSYGLIVEATVPVRVTDQVRTP